MGDVEERRIIDRGRMQLGELRGARGDARLGVSGDARTYRGRDVEVRVPHVLARGRVGRMRGLLPRVRLARERVQLAQARAEVVLVDERREIALSAGGGDAP